jgi:phage replication-related protein YjqB (UPF0714/DUF867 family)
MADKYFDYQELRASTTNTRDYVVFSRDGDSRYAIMAVHGGGIEPGTSDIADRVAGHRHAFYTFKGIKQAGNRDLHLTSNHFDEPIGLQLAAKAEIVLAVHGCRGSAANVYVGGRHMALKVHLIDQLNAAGFEAGTAGKPGLGGMHRANICNRGSSGMGVQLEITRGLREKMFSHLNRRSQRTRTDVFDQFVMAVQKALSLNGPG